MIQLEGIVEREENGVVVLAPAHRSPIRRILHVNVYGGAFVWKQVKNGMLPGHQFLGCIELAKMGYEVALAEPLPDFYLHRNPLPHDLRLYKMIRSWLGKDGLVFCGHNVLYWIPLLRQLGFVHCPVISLLYAREPLNFAKFHQGIICLTPAAAEQARKLAPQAKIVNLGWGVDLKLYPKLNYDPHWFLSCGIANRDFPTLSLAAKLTERPLRVICPGLQSGLSWPTNVTVLDGGRGWLTDRTKAVVSVQDFIRGNYAQSAGTLIVLKSDPTEYTANGFTNMIEAMAVGQPLIVTRTGALPSELDVEKEGCGLHVPAGDAKALAQAIDSLANAPELARAMGEKGRKLCENYYNLDRYARDLHKFFQLF